MPDVKEYPTFDHPWMKRFCPCAGYLTYLPTYYTYPSYLPESRLLTFGHQSDRLTFSSLEFHIPTLTASSSLTRDSLSYLR